MPTKRNYSYIVVDVFTEKPFAGNPLAVFPDAAGLGDAEMQMLARELNLSETSFVFASSDSAYAARLRIFTPGMEVEFAGHPTIGTAFVLTELGRIPTGVRDFVLSEVIGPVPIRLERRADPFVAWLRTPPITLGATLDRGACARALALDESELLGDHPPQLAGAGNPFAYVALADMGAVDRASLDATAAERLAPNSTANGFFVFTPTAQGVYARMFAPRSGIMEDPATGSATGPLAAYMLQRGLMEKRDGLRFVNEQGTAMGRQSFVHGLLHVADGELKTVEVGGSAVRVIEGSVEL